MGHSMMLRNSSMDLREDRYTGEPVTEKHVVIELPVLNDQVERESVAEFGAVVDRTAMSAASLCLARTRTKCSRAASHSRLVAVFAAWIKTKASTRT